MEEKLFDETAAKFRWQPQTVKLVKLVLVDGLSIPSVAESYQTAVPFIHGKIAQLEARIEYPELNRELSIILQNKNHNKHARRRAVKALRKAGFNIQEKVND